MADITLPDETETRAFHRHAGLASASMDGFLGLCSTGGYSGPWTLKQVQGDEVFHG
jgi:hypothetical protein